MIGHKDTERGQLLDCEGWDFDIIIEEKLLDGIGSPQPVLVTNVIHLIQYGDWWHNAQSDGPGS